jgi:hypothetical protein
MKRMSFMLALLLAIAAPAFAQIQGGSISGTVKDEQGGVLPGVTITAQGLDATQTFVTEGNGEYRFLNLAPGPYKITATLSGFTTVVREDVIVAVGRSVELPLSLKIATVAERSPSSASHRSSIPGPPARPPTSRLTSSPRFRPRAIRSR